MLNFGNVFILGDSYSTFEGYIPSGYASYYNNRESGATDVNAVEQTWWFKLITETNSLLVMNDSWSGSTVCHTGYNNSDCSKSSSFVCRLNKYVSEGFFKKNKIDTIFCFGATNDSWALSPLGNFKTENFIEEELFSFLPAVSFLLSELQVNVPKARIIYIINTDLKEEISNGIVNACEYYGIGYVKLNEIDKIDGHPTVKGMQQIKDEILENLK